MKNTIEKVVTKNNIIIFIILSVLIGGISYLNFATDTYATFSHVEYSAKDMLTRNGRPVIGIVYYMWAKMNIPNEMFFYISTVLSFLFMLGSIKLLSDILSKYILNEICNILVSIIFIANVFIVEYFMFIEKGMFIFSIFLNVVAFYYMLNYFENNYTKNMFKALFVMMLATFTYQGIVAIFVVMCLPFVFYFSDTINKYMKNMFLVLLIYGIPCFLNII